MLSPASARVAEGMENTFLKRYEKGGGGRREERMRGGGEREEKRTRGGEGKNQEEYLGKLATST